MKRPDIFVYHDYRAYLRDLFAHLKESHTGLSTRKMAKQCSLSVSYLSMVMSGKRSLSEKTVAQLADCLGLSSSEHSYFKNLCNFTDSTSTEESAEFLKKLQKFVDYQKNNPEEAEIYEYLTHWYYLAIREMAALPGFSLEPKWIQERLAFPVALADVEKATKFLLEKKFLSVDAEGQIHPPERKIACIGSVYKIALQQFYKEIFGLASQSMSSIPHSERDITGYTLPIAAKDFSKVKKILEKARTEIAALSSEPDAKDCVYQVSLMSFPLSKKTDGGGLPNGGKNSAA